MLIDFFKNTCKTSSKEKVFGLCDNPPPATDPAYIDETDNSKWIAEVSNNNSLEANLYAIDHCVDIFRPNGEMESRCDGVLTHTDTLIFVELKDRVSSGWLAKGREQLTTTIQNFIANHDISAYNKVEAYVCNKQRPLAVTNISTVVQMFKDDTSVMLNSKGLELKADRNITI
ncbi:MAG: hypothetical protein IPN76_25775 [Saprospiraceae bacterium]|nr:hypothetical protein [Saprospiraceae bacterium]